MLLSSETGKPLALFQDDGLLTSIRTAAAGALAASLINTDKPRIIAMGSDSPGKMELDPVVLQRADVIVTDDHEQCLHHGEFGHAVRAGLINNSKDISLGDVLHNPSILRLNKNSISIVDLTGLGAQDLAISSMVYNKI